MRGNPQDRQSRVHWKDELSWNGVIAIATMLSLFGTAAMAYATFDSRMAKVETHIINQAKVDEAQDKKADADDAQIRAELQRLNQKLDRIYEILIDRKVQ